MPKFICKEPVRHDGKDYGVGDPITLDEAQAKPLIGFGAVVTEASAKSAAEAEAMAAAKNAGNEG